jgi:hypothetical protein
MLIANVIEALDSNKEKDVIEFIKYILKLIDKKRAKILAPWLDPKLEYPKKILEDIKSNTTAITEPQNAFNCSISDASKGKI